MSGGPTPSGGNLFCSQSTGCYRVGQYDTGMGRSSLKLTEKVHLKKGTYKKIVLIWGSYFI